MPSRSIRQALTLASAFALSHCATAPRPVPQTHVTGARVPRDPNQASRSPAGEPEGALRSRVDAVAQAFRERSSHPVAERWVAFLMNGTERTMTVRLDRDLCLGFVAVGRESVTDINITVHNSAGVSIAEDTRSDAHPYVRVCVREGDELYVLVHAVHGSGEIAVLTVTEPPLVPPNLDSILGVRTAGSFTGPRTPRVAIGNDPAVPDAPHALEHMIDRFTPLGYRRVGAVANGRLDTQRQDEREVALTAGLCYAVVAAGGPGVEDLDLRLVSPDDQVLAQDTNTDSHPILRVCPVVTGPHRIDVRMYSGAGTWTFALLAMDPPIELPDDILGIERANALELAADGRRHGMALLMPPIRAAVLNAAPLGISVQLRAGRCYVFGAAGNESIPGMEVSFVDEHGAVASSDTGARPVARVFHCAQRSGRGRVDIRGIGGRGEYVFVALESRAATP